VDNRPQPPTEFFEKAGAYEQLVQIEGFKYLKAKMAEAVQANTNDALTGKGFATTDEYHERRGEIIGMQKLLSDVTMTLQQLERYRKEQHDQQAG